ncbi:CHAD domain-containing protein [Streptomyces sp. NPDC058274]|uniref:CYTH and CHAD domain-containing protein n=1 Tax=Streptomyces sp. NPDC058274 TaxID=3346416 RepID=UPI0036EF55F5
MADIKREIERKYEGPTTGGGTGLPDLTKVSGVTGVIGKGVSELDATYYDTADQLLAAASITLRRRTGGADAGWHLKLPVSEGVRDEIHAPLSDTVPHALTSLVRSRLRDAELLPVVRLRSSRDVHHLVDDSGALLAEASVDRVRAERLSDGKGSAQWTEIEVELADDGDPAFLDKVEKKLLKAGLHRSASPSKLARALAETGAAAPARTPAPGKPPATAGDHVLAYVRAQRDALVELDPAVRRDLPDAVHRMRVATRRLRNVLRSYDGVLDRTVTDPLRDELKWLAGELAGERDQEVITRRLTASLDDLPKALRSGPVRNRLRTWSQARHSGSRRSLIEVLDGRRYLYLLAALDALVSDPPLRKAAGKKPAKVMRKAVRKDFEKLKDLVAEARGLPPGEERDLATHEARKKAKRTRYAAEAAVPALGKPAQSVAKSTKTLQKLLGDHQDSVMARDALRDLADKAQAAGESSFTYGLLYGREERQAAADESALAKAWKKAERKAAF